MNLSYLILLPLLTAVGILLCSTAKQVKAVSLAGAIMQLLLTGVLLFVYCKQRAEGNNADMLFEYNHSWFASLHINYHVGVDGISIAMILLTALVVLAGVLVSWTIDTLPKSFF